MMDAFGDRQQELLTLLLKKKQGLTVDELSEKLGVTRTATRQHLAALERLGYVQRGVLASTGGRPSQTYLLAPKGYDLFPKKYSWFSEVLLDSLKQELGSDGLKKLMRKLGQQVAEEVAAQIDSKDLKSRIAGTVKIMNDLAFQAEAIEGQPAIEATNCIYHALAKQFPEVCEFDLSLLSKLTQSPITHEECIIRGGGTCRFRFRGR